MSNDGGVSTLGVKTIPRRPGLQGCARAGWGWGYTQGDGDPSPWPGGVGSSLQILPALAWPGDWCWATWPGTPLQASLCPCALGELGDWRGVLAEEGGMVWRKSRKIQHKHPGDCGGGERGSLGRHLSLVHREEKDTIYKAVRL